ncbi:MAG: hypothetical protein ACFCVE_15475 [Phycisphaerae bacterium]
MKHVIYIAGVVAMVAVAGCRQKGEQPTTLPATKPAAAAYARPVARPAEPKPPARPTAPAADAQPPARPVVMPPVTRPSRPTTTPAEAQVTRNVYEGQLRGGMMAIGGETTGYVLRTGQRQIEVDLSKIDGSPERYEGGQVRIIGEIVERDYVERGPTPVLVAREIELQ